VVTAGQQRACVDWACQRYGVSQRRACRAPGRARSTARYRRRARPGEAALARAVPRLARRHPRRGYRRVHARLRAGGWAVIPYAARMLVELGRKMYGTQQDLGSGGGRKPLH
jgi:hypothetical protein